MSGDSRAAYKLQLMSALAEAMNLLVEPVDFEVARNDASRIVGEAAQADRIYIFESVDAAQHGDARFRACYHWENGGPVFHSGDSSEGSFPAAESPLLKGLRSGQPISGFTKDLTVKERAHLGSQGVFSYVFVPIMVRGLFWGFVGLGSEDGERTWTASEIECLRALSAGLAGAIARHQTEESFKAQAQELRKHRRAALSLAEDARRSESAAEQASVAKTTFLAMMSHEIRTPLNGVIGFTDLLLTEGLPDRQSEIAHAVKTCGETLLSLISDILDISKIESGKLELNAESVDVAESARSVLATFEPSARKKGVVLDLSVAEDVPPWLWLDANRFCQILFNLVGNAVKFTSQGRIKVMLWVERSEGARIKLLGKVSDTGLGMSGDELSSVFEPFLQGEGARRTASGGSGLGLAICRRLVEAMGGKIGVTSRPGEGSEFSFSLSVFDALAPDKVSGVAVNAPADGVVASASILVVDDVYMNVKLVLNLLKRLGYAADTASSGLQALQMVRDKSYDLIFTDVLMPEMDGHEMTRQIREMQRVSEAGRTWIVALTADALLENRLSCAEAGMDDFLTKPLRLRDIEGALDRWKAGQPTLKN